MKTRIFLFAILLVGFACQKKDDVLSNDLVETELKPTGDWWCYVLDYGASDPNDWCPPTSYYCDCGKAVIVVPSLQSVANEFNGVVNNKTDLSNFAQSSDWDFLFESVNSFGNTVLNTVHSLAVNENYHNVQIDTINEVVYYISQDDSSDLGTLRLEM